MPETNHTIQAVHLFDTVCIDTGTAHFAPDSWPALQCVFV